MSGSARANLDPAVAEDTKLFLSQGCAACHQAGAAQIAPNQQGLLGSTRVFADGSELIADEAYIKSLK